MVPLRRLWSSSYPPNAFGLYDMYLRASQRPRIFMPTVMTVWFSIVAYHFEVGAMPRCFRKNRNKDEPLGKPRRPSRRAFSMLIQVSPLAPGMDPDLTVGQRPIFRRK